MFIFQLGWFLLWVTAQQGDSGMRAAAEDGICKLSAVKVSPPPLSTLLHGGLDFL